MIKFINSIMNFNHAQLALFFIRLMHLILFKCPTLQESRVKTSGKVGC